MNESVSDFILLLLNLGLRMTRFLLCHSGTVSRTSHRTTLRSPGTFLQNNSQHFPLRLSVTQCTS